MQSVFCIQAFMGSGFTGQCYLNAEPLTSKSRTVIPFSISTCFQVYFISTFPIPNSITLLHALCPCSMHPAIDYLFRLPYSEFTYAGSIITHSPFRIPHSKSLCLCFLSSFFRHLSSVFRHLSSIPVKRHLKSLLQGKIVFKIEN